MFKVPSEVLKNDKEFIEALISIIDTYELDLKSLKHNAEMQLKLLEENYGV